MRFSFRLVRVVGVPCVAAACLASSMVAQVPSVECQPGFCGSWSEAYDWGIATCAEGDTAAGCDTVACGTGPHGELAHAVLVLKNPTASPPEWRVLLINTGHPDSTEQTWWIWDPATPADLQPGTNLPEVVFCSGHTTLADGRVFFAGGHRWTPAGGGCTGVGPKWTWIYDPASNTWTKGPDLTKTRYYPSPLQESDGRVLVIGGDFLPTEFEVYLPAASPGVGTFDPNGPYVYSTLPTCPASYPHTHLLPARLPAGGQAYRGTVLISSPFLYQDTFNCSGVDQTIPSQILPLPASPPDYSLAWEPGPMPSTDSDRVENGSVLIVDTTGPSAEARVYIAAGRAGYEGPLLATAESFANPQTGTMGVPLPSLNISRFEASFVLIPGRRLLAMGGDKLAAIAQPILAPEILDLADPSATWIKLAEHAQERVYHSWALLLPDGRVLHGGGRKVNQFDPSYFHAQVFTPPYDKGGAGPPGRKARFGAGNPTSMAYGSQPTFHLADDPEAGVWEFELIRPGSMTHTVDFDQRMVILAHQDLGGGNYQLTAPASPDLAPPGWYMLFAVSNRGIPSLAHFVHLP